MNPTAIEYTDYTWNPIVGCSHGCPWCYARRLSKRQPCQRCKSFQPHLHRERLDQPRRVKRPSRILTCSMGDVLDPMLTSWECQCVCAAMMGAPWHTFQLLTKNPGRIPGLILDLSLERTPTAAVDTWDALESVWWGTSISHQGEAGRVADLLQVLTYRPTALLWLSCEPLLGPVADAIDPRLSWVVLGGLTGPGRKPQHADEWGRDALARCDQLGIPVFIKDNLPGQDPRRDFPRTAVAWG